MINWSKYKNYHSLKPNKNKMPINQFSTSQEDLDEFNEIYKYCYDLAQQGILHDFVKGDSGCIRYSRGMLRGPMWGIWHTKTMIMLILRHPEDAHFYKFVVGFTKDKDDKKGKGRNAFCTYKYELSKDGIVLEDYALKGTKAENEEVKKTIEKPLIESKVMFGRTFYNAHHLDLNSSYQAGISKAFPEFKPTIERIYNKRNDNPVYKDILNMTQGYMQSDIVQYRFAHISKAGIDWNNQRIREITKDLENAGRRILGYNTDGVWYQGEIYHDENEGTALGQWKNDAINCQLRYKSHGCYEYIGQKLKKGEYLPPKYYPVFRGESTYEMEKPKDQWEWGDIFKGSEYKYKLVPGEGVIKYDYT